MAKSTLGALLALMIFAAVGAFAQDSPDELAQSTSDGVLKIAQLTPEQQRQLAVLRRKAYNAACPGAFPVPIAVSVWGWTYYTGGQDTLLTYPNLNINEGGAWGNNSTLAAPCAGLYFFTVEFEKDPGPNGGTTDDVQIFLYKNSTWVGQAWAGETTSGDRETGAYSVILRLAKGDYVQTFVHSDGGKMRNIGYYNFTAHRIGD